MPGSDPTRESIEAFNRARGGGVAVRRTGHGYSLSSEHSGAPIARLKPTGDTGGAQVFWWNGRCWGASGPLGTATMPLDAALDYIASDPTFWVNA